MKAGNFILVTLLSLFFYSFNSSLIAKTGPENGEKWVAVHLLNYNDDDALDSLGMAVPQLAQMGVNVIFLEVDYSFDYKSHPELRRGDKNITKDGARKFSKICKDNDIRLMIEFQSLGHQSWAHETFPLLTKYPELDITPGAYPNNDSIYCREWDPTNPRVYEIVDTLIDELIDAFEVDGFHVGMDEVFLLNDSLAAKTNNIWPAKLFAQAVNDLYNHIVKKRGLQMFMWGDRLIDGNKYKYGAWESSENCTAAAINMIPKDIVICDWHYETRDTYPSIPMFLKKGFKVLPTTWRNRVASNAFLTYSLEQDNPNMLGVIYSTWSANISRLLNSSPIKDGVKLIK